MSDAARASEVAAWRRWLALAGGVVLGLVFLVAGWAKVIHPHGFAEEIRSEGLEILLPAEVLSVLFVAFEIALGVALMLAIRRLWVLLPTSALVAFFLFLNGRALWRFSNGLISEDEACGCFGNLVSRTPAQAFWQDLLLLVPPLLLIFLGGRSAPAGRPRLAIVALAAVAALVFGTLAPGLPLDDLATRLGPGVRVEELCAGRDSDEGVRVCLDTLMPELGEGRHLVVMSELDNPALLASVDSLNALALSAADERLWLLTAASEEERQAFFWQWGPAFEIREAPQPLLSPLYRRLPRAFQVVDGRVEETMAALDEILPAP